MEHRQIVAVTVGRAVFTAGTAALIGTVVIAITSPYQERGVWFGLLLYAGVAIAFLGAYVLLAAWLGLWLPSPRERFIGRTLWDRIQQFKAIVAGAREWPEMREWLRLQARLESKQA